MLYFRCEFPCNWSTWQFPPNLTHLRLGDNYNSGFYENDLIALPSTLRILEFGANFTSYVKLPTSLEKLTFGESFNRCFQMIRKIQFVYHKV
jgi:hypothetical protein